MKLNTLIIGNGGREHSLTQSIVCSESAGKIFVSPGNPGTELIAQNVWIDFNNKQNVADFCKQNDIHLVVIGPEQYLADGLTDFLSSNGINVFGPSKYAAQLETSKNFAKNIMKAANVPTANYRNFSNQDKKDAIEYVQNLSYPLVIKADGLAAGKGVIICQEVNEAILTINDIFDGKFGEAGNNILIEEFLEGDEASIFAISDGKDYFILPPSQDFKKSEDGDKGKNTGGMGSYCPTPLINYKLLSEIEQQVIKPMIDYLYSNNTPFVGCLYAGLMITPDKEAKVIEFNARFGDPETQSVLNVIEGDFLKFLYSASTGHLDKNIIKQKENCYATTLILTSKGYPDSFEKGFEIKGLEESTNTGVNIYHSGTISRDNKLLTNGGRVLGVTGISDNLFDSIKKVYKAASLIHFANKYHRNDIGVRGIQYLEW